MRMKKKYEGKKKLHVSTHVKYALSYFLIITVLFLGFVFILRQQLTKLSTIQQTKELQIKLDNVSEWITDNYNHLDLISNSLDESITITSAFYSKIPARQYYVHRELLKYDAGSQLISSIIGKFHNNADIAYSGHSVTYSEGLFYIRNISSTDAAIAFDPAPYLDTAKGQFILISNEQSQFFLYLPHTPMPQRNLFFFVLDTNLIKQQLTNIISDDIPALALLDENGQMITGINISRLMPYIDSLELSEGSYKQDSGTSIYVHTDMTGGLSLVCLLSNDALNRQINDAFANSYLALLLLSVTGFILVLFSMRITYVPLHRLTQKLVPNSSTRESYLNLLESTFYKEAEEKQLLYDKLEYYRTSMQKSLLSSVVLSKCPDPTMLASNIDRLFDMESSKKIFMLKMAAPDNVLPYPDILSHFQKKLSPHSSCIVQEVQADGVVFLISYAGSEPHKELKLLEILNQYQKEQGYLSAISYGSESPLDIPSLYEVMMLASRCWPQIPVADYHSTPATATIFAYPHDKLEQLSRLLKENDFLKAKITTDELFETIHSSVQTKSSLPDFFLHCILIDMLTVIINCINQHGIKFKSYSDLYSETLYYCRSCNYEDKETEIRENVHTLIDFYAQEISNLTVDFAQVIQQIQRSYLDPEFSIALLADRFGISTTYMSYLIKKNLNLTFSDYLWELRLEKSWEMLKNTELSIDEISVAVGYLNTSSFRRKFKQKTGITPTQYRNTNKKGAVKKQF